MYKRFSATCPEPLFTALLFPFPGEVCSVRTAQPAADQLIWAEVLLYSGVRRFVYLDQNQR